MRRRIAIAEHGGRIVKNTGDGVLAEFPSAVEAVRAAVQFQTRIKELAAIKDWVGSADPMLLFEAIGGMGKSMVTWEWVSNHAAADRSPADRPARAA